MPRGVCPRYAGGAVWNAPRVRTLSADELWRVYRAELAALRAAGDPATSASVSDRRREALVSHVYKLRVELRRRHLLPVSPREAACRGD